MPPILPDFYPPLNGYLSGFSKLIGGSFVFITTFSAIKVMAFSENDLRRLINTKVCVGCDLTFVGSERFPTGRGGPISFSRGNITGSNFTGAGLPFFDFSFGTHNGVNFTNAVIDGIDFQGSNLTDANFTGASVTRANFTSVPGFTRTVLTNANFTDSDLFLARFSNSNLTCKDFVS